MINFDPISKKDYENYSNFFRSINKVIDRMISNEWCCLEEIHHYFGVNIVKTTIKNDNTQHDPYDPFRSRSKVVFLVTDLKNDVIHADLLYFGRATFLLCPRNSDYPIGQSSGDLSFIRFSSHNRPNDEKISYIKVKEMINWSIGQIGRKNGPTWIRSFEKDYTHKWMSLSGVNYTDEIIKIANTIGVNPSDMTQAERGLLLSCISEYLV